MDGHEICKHVANLDESGTNREVVLKKDTLQQLFDLQKQLQKRIYGVDLPAVDYELLVIQVTGLVAELGEVLGADKNWKMWKRTKVPVNSQHVIEEIADMWHFLINITLTLGFDADDVVENFITKNKVNHERQDKHY